MIKNNKRDQYKQKLIDRENRIQYHYDIEDPRERQAEAKKRREEEENRKLLKKILLINKWEIIKDRVNIIQLSSTYRGNVLKKNYQI